MQERYLDIVTAVDTEFARNRRRYGEKIHCGAGCTDCCFQLFQITEIDVHGMNVRSEICVNGRVARFLRVPEEWATGASLMVTVERKPGGSTPRLR